VEVVASLSQGRTAAAQCGLFTYKSVPVIFETPCTSTPSSKISFQLASIKRHSSRSIYDDFGGGGNVIINVMNRSTQTHTHTHSFTHSITHSHTDAMYGAESFARS